MIGEVVALAIGVAAGLRLRRDRRRAHEPRALLLAVAGLPPWRWRAAYEAGEVTFQGACAWCGSPAAAVDQPPPCGCAQARQTGYRPPPQTAIPGPPARGRR